MVGRLCHVHIHFAGLGAFPTGDAFAPVYLNLEQRYPVEQRVKRTQRAQPLAEGPVKYDTQHDHCQQNTEFPGKQAAQRRPDAGIGKGQRNGALQHALGAEVLAEEGVAHAHVVHKECRQQKDHHQQNGVLQVCQGLQLLCGELLCGDLMQQLLKPAEGTQKAANKAPQQNSQQNEKTCDVIGKAEFGRAYHCLKRSDGAGAGSRRTGIAVQPRHTDGFPRALIQSALEEIRQVQVGQ